jgi:hypothetical protein
VPRESEFALLGASPNPSVGDVRLSFMLPDQANAIVHLFDLGGRMVLRRDLGSMGPGAYVRTIDFGPRFPAGIYVLRLGQSGRSATRRVSIIR